MSLKYFKPTTPSQRGRVSLDLSELKISKKKKEDWKGILKFLRQGKKEKAGRNNQGRITIRHRGGGHKRSYRKILFQRNLLSELLKKYYPEQSFSAFVEHLVYDPNRTTSLALLSVNLPEEVKENKVELSKEAKLRGIFYNQGHSLWCYILAPKGLKEGDEIPVTRNKTMTSSPYQIGEAFPVEEASLGWFIHNLEIHKGQGGKLARAAGTYGQVIEKSEEMKRVRIRLPSKEERWLNYGSVVSLGSLGNADRSHLRLAKAGRSRWLSRRPAVRGVAMNPVDHPHGGGEGRTSGGRPSVTPWGRPTRHWKRASLKKKKNLYRITGLTKN